MNEMSIISELRNRLAKNVERVHPDGVLLSGGLDSSIVASLAPYAKAYTVTLEDFGSDYQYAKLVSETLRMKWHCKKVTINEAIESIPTVMRVLKSFDPIIPNNLAAYFGIRLAKEQGCEVLMTGDGADELFAGYKFMLNVDLKEYIPKMVKTMTFSSNCLGNSVGVSIYQPYIEKDFLDFALSIDPSLKIRTLNGVPWGKWILRKAFEDRLPEEIIWRVKTPLEFGSGFTRLRNILGSSISQEDFEKRKRDYSINFRSRDHLYLYEIYRKLIGEIPKPKKDEKVCKDCGAGLPVHLRHCRVCGGYPV